MIISTRSPFTKMASYPGTKLVGVADKSRKKMKNSLSCVHVLHKTLNGVISRCCFAEDSKEMYQNVKRTCRVIVFAHQTYCFAALLLLLPSSCLSSLSMKHKLRARTAKIIGVANTSYTCTIECCYPSLSAISLKCYCLLG